MGRRKIEIKAIKDDRNRSVTFLKRKGGLFKKAHELSVLCSVDVAVFIFGSNKKLYEYSSSSMPDLMTRYHYHNGVSEHKGPSDFNGGADDDGSDDENGSPPQAEGIETHMPINFQGQPPFPHPHMRHHTPSASPPIQNGAFVQHPGHPIHRGHTPQPPHMGSRPSSRNDIRRMGPNMGQPNGPPAPPQVNGYAYMPQPAIYNPQNQQNMNRPMPQGGAQYAVYPPQQAHAHQMQSYMEDQRRSSLPPNFPPQGPQQAPPQIQRHSVSPPQPAASQLPAQTMHMSPPPPQHQHHPMQSPPLPQHHHQQQQQQQHDEQQRQQQYQQQHQPQNQQQQQESQQPPQVHIQEPLAPPLPDVKAEPSSKPMRQPPLLDTQVKRLPQRKGGSIFTPIDGPSSILAQHLSAFHSASDPSKSDGNRSHSVDVGSISRGNPTSSPPQAPRSNAPASDKRHNSVISIPERTFTPPSRTNSLQTPGGAARPRLKVQIPEEASEAGSATAGSSSPRNTSTDNTSQHSRGMVLPPPSPSVDASSLLSAGATGPPNPFARPVRNQDQQQQQQAHQGMNIDTPVSALPSRMMGNEFLPSPSSFYPDWNFRGNESNTLPSPLNFATPVVGTGPSFLRDDNPPPQHKRKSPEISHAAGHEGAEHGNEPKRVKVET